MQNKEQHQQAEYYKKLGKAKKNMITYFCLALRMQKQRCLILYGLITFSEKYKLKFTKLIK